MVSHDVIKARQQTQAGADLHMHGSVHVVEEIESLVDQLAALLQKTWKSKGKVVKSAGMALYSVKSIYLEYRNASHPAALWPVHSGRSGMRRRLWGSRASQQGKCSGCPPL